MSLQTLLSDASKEGCPNVEKVKKILSQYPQLNSKAEAHAAQYLSALQNSLYQQELESKQKQLASNQTGDGTYKVSKELEKQTLQTEIKLLGENRYAASNTHLDSISPRHGSTESLSHSSSFGFDRLNNLNDEGMSILTNDIDMKGLHTPLFSNSSNISPIPTSANGLRATDIPRTLSFDEVFNNPKTEVTSDTKSYEYVGRIKNPNQLGLNFNKAESFEEVFGPNNHQTIYSHVGENKPVVNSNQLDLDFNKANSFAEVFGDTNYPKTYQYVSNVKQGFNSNQLSLDFDRTQSLTEVFGDKKTNISGKRIPTLNLESEGQQSLFSYKPPEKQVAKEPINLLWKTLTIPNVSGSWSNNLTTFNKGFVRLTTNNDINNTISSQHLEKEMVHYKGEGDGTLSVPKKTITPLEGKFPLTLYSPPEENIPKTLGTTNNINHIGVDVPADFRKLTPNTVNLNFPAKSIVENITPKYSLCTNKFSLSPTCNSKNLGKDSKSVVTGKQPKLSEFSISINRVDDIGNVKVFNKTTNKEVPFNKFALSYEGDGTASIGFVERADTLSENKGAGRAAYKLLGEQLHSQGIKLTSSGTLQAPGKKLWDDLVSDGYAKKVAGGGYEFTPKQSTTPISKVITPTTNPVTPTQQASQLQVSTHTTPTNHIVSTTDLGNKNVIPSSLLRAVQPAVYPHTFNFVSNNVPPHKLTSTFTPSTSSTTTPVKSTGSPHRSTTPINRGGKSFSETLKGMGIYVLDVETTGLNLDDKMYSASFSKSTEGVDGKIIQNVDEHFNIKDKWKETKHFTDASGNYDREKHIRAVEAQLAKKHSSKKFGQDQKARGSLRETAEAIVDGKTNTPTDFLQQLEKSISSDKQGSVVFAHNANFEDDVFNRYNKDGTKPYKDIFSTLENRNISNSSGIMSVDDTISNKTRVEDHKGSRQRANKYYHEHLKHSIRSGDTSLIDSGLKEYASKQMDVIDDIFKSINKARATPGAYAVVDSMDLARAAMSFGALNGDVNIGNLRLGASIDTMARAWYGEEEKHTAKGDVELQRRVTNDLLTEIDEYRKDSSYRSVRIAQLNAFINKEDEATKTFQRSAINQFNRMIKSRDDTKGFADFERFLTNMKEDYDIASGNHNDRLAFLNKFNQTRNELLSNESLSIQKVKDELERIMSKPGDIDTPSAKANKVASEGFDLLEHVKSHKGKYGIGAAVVAGTLLLGGGEEGKNDKYNTYDELYNGMYYGTPFADWQERNNAHKILY